MKALQIQLWLPSILLVACQGPTQKQGPEAGQSRSEAGVIKIAQAGAEPGQINFREPLYRRFTDHFSEAAVLLADRIEVYGPSDLLEHLAVRQEVEVFDSKIRTTPEGLRQELTRKPKLVGGEAFAQLDQWKLYALHKLIVVQAPDDQPVRILALGQAVFLPDGNTAGEVKQERIEITGYHGKQ